ncbi:MAG: cobalamin biosynthesis protein [Chloroflexi bacterium]|nr:cobalamin biosynthesis protein [Chloroflexota bacterium]
MRTDQPAPMSRHSTLPTVDVEGAHAPTLVAVGRSGAGLAARLRAAWPGSRLVLGGRVARLGAGVPDDVADDVAAAVGRLFRAGQPLVLFLPVGAAVRLLAPHLGDKAIDPPAVCVDEAGRFAVALVGGRRGGANALARRIAAALGARPVITSAAEALGLPALDLLGRAQGWTLEASEAALTRAEAALVSGEPVGYYQDAGERLLRAGRPAWLSRWTSLAALAAAPLAVRLVISDRRRMELPPRDDWLVYRPRTVVVGLGCARGAATAEIERLVDEALRQANVAPQAVRAVATIDLKAEEPGLREVIARHGWPLVTYGAAELAAVPGRYERSAMVERAVGTPAVAAPAALLAAGAGRLLLPKLRSKHVTAALARVPSRQARCAKPLRARIASP